jgi:quercetin dioxygenase-like cupin family protein
MAVKGKPQQQLKTMKTLDVTNPIHRSPLQRALLLIAPAFVIIAALTAVPSRATTGCGTTNTNLLSPVPFGYFPDGLLDLMCMQLGFGWDLKTKVKGDSDVYVTLVTFQPGAQTGWHSHPGPSLITVIEGTLTVYKDDCTFTTYGVGESFTDIGCGDVHNVVNETGMEAKDVAVQIVPHTAPRRDDKPDPGCPQVTPCPAF